MPPHGSIEGPFQPFSSIRPSKDQKQDVSTKSVSPGGEILGQLAPATASGDFFSEFFGMQILFGRSCLIWPKKSVCLEAFGAGFWAFSGSKYSNSAVRPQGESGSPSQSLEKF